MDKKVKVLEDLKQCNNMLTNGHSNYFNVGEVFSNTRNMPLEYRPRFAKFIEKIIKELEDEIASY